MVSITGKKEIGEDSNWTHCGVEQEATEKLISAGVSNSSYHSHQGGRLPRLLQP